MIEHFKFEIKPWYYGNRDGLREKLLKTTVVVNGQELTSSRIIYDQRPFESEVEYYTRMAVSSLHEQLEKLENEKENT